MRIVTGRGNNREELSLPHGSVFSKEAKTGDIGMVRQFVGGLIKTMESRGVAFKAM